jgi:DNA mismatch repair ATPase MutS
MAIISITDFVIREFFRSFRSQVNFFHSRLAGFVTLFRVGHFFEAYGSDAQEITDLCRLWLLSEKRRVNACAGFPVWRLPGMLEKIIGAGKNVAIVEQGEEGQYVRKRYVWQIYCNGSI